MASGQSHSLAWAEVFRGLAILGVLLIHLSGRFVRELPEGGLEWTLLAALGRAATFAVPAFLTLSTLLLGLSLRRGLRPGVYARARLTSLAWPLVLWTAVFLSLSDPPPVADPRLLSGWLVWGKAHFHLYYLALALQLALVMPLLVALAGRLGVGWLALGGVVLTALTYWANRQGPFLPYPGSSLLWYIPAVTLGLCGSRLEDLPSALRRLWPWAAGAGSAGLAAFLPVSLEALRGGRVDTAVYQFSHWSYSAALTVLLAGVSVWLAETRARRLLELMGRNSLQIYLMHPLVLLWLDHSARLSERLGALPAMPVYLALFMLVPLGLAALARRARSSELLFGR